jgi:adenylyltransferase/sulfurtransferase
MPNNPLPNLSPAELLRYARHLTLAEVGVDGQRRLKAARVLLVGAGGLGSPAGLYLAAAGVGTLGIVDDDRVDATNLQRQVLHGVSGIGTLKTQSAVARLGDLNPSVEVERLDVRLTSANAMEIVRRFDLVVDGSDNFPTRYLVNDACVLTGRPYVYGSIFRFQGQVSVFAAQGGPCYRCLYAEPPAADLIPSCAEAGVLGAVPGVIGTLQATEAIKLVLGVGSPLVGRLLLFDALSLRFRELAVRADPDCVLCGPRRTLTELIDYEAFCGTHSAPAGAAEITAAELHRRLSGSDGAPPLVLDVREPWEWEIVRIPGGRLIPLGDLAARVGELDSRREIVTVCHRGSRSLQARDLLAAAGFSKVWSLAGGIEAWTVEVDPELARY